MKTLANNKVIGGIVVLVAALVLSVFATSASFRRRVDATFLKISTMFDRTENQAASASSALDKMQGKRARGPVKTLADGDTRDRRTEIRSAARGFVDERSKSGKFPIYDEVGGRLLELRFERQHDEIGDEAGILTSCFDFRDDAGRLIDVDVLVIRDADGVRATMARLHAVDGNSRIP